MEWILISTVIVGGVSLAAGYGLRVLQSRKSLTGAEFKAKQVLEQATRDAESIAKQAKLDGKEQLHALRQEFERESKDRRHEVTQLEKRLHQREELLDRKLDLSNRKEKDSSERERQLVVREQGAKHREDQLENLLAEEKEKLKAVSGLSA